MASLTELERKLGMILREKQSVLRPNILRKGYTFLGIEGSIDNYTGDYTGNATVPLNVFMQETEPEKKDGIWLQGNYEVENIIADTNVLAANEWDIERMKLLSPIPYNFYWGAAEAIGTYIYLFGGSSAKTTAYKYDTLFDVYTRISDIPFSFYQGASCVKGTDIYLFGGENAPNTAYKYDTLTDTYTQLANIPYEFQESDLTIVEDEIFLFGSRAYQSTKKAAIYNITTDSYTSITCPYELYNGSVNAVGTDIYLIGGSKQHSSVYKYDTLTRLSTKLNSAPVSFDEYTSVVIGNKIYLIGNYDSKVETYVYDTATETFTKLDDNSMYTTKYGSAVFSGKYIYVFGSSSYPTRVQVLTITPKAYPAKSIVISQDGSLHKSTIISSTGIDNLKTYYDRAYYMDENSSLLPLPTYNGDGTTWTEI